jgi:two-component system sensor histidine kinase VicK
MLWEKFESYLTNKEFRFSLFRVYGGSGIDSEMMPRLFSKFATKS